MDLVLPRVVGVQWSIREKRLRTHLRSLKHCTVGREHPLTFLDRYIDRNLTVSPEDSAEKFAADELLRIQQHHAVMRALAAHPRRLGGDATSDELADDKRRAKRVLHALDQCLTAWGGQPTEWEEASKIAATLDITAWREQHEVRIRARQKYLATWWIRYGNQNGDKRFVNQAINRLENELRWVAYALR